eukprot:10189647-Alexandrium_andersonii.AAC.1
MRGEPLRERQCQVEDGVTDADEVDAGVRERCPFSDCGQRATWAGGAIRACHRWCRACCAVADD